MTGSTVKFVHLSLSAAIAERCGRRGKGMMGDGEGGRGRGEGGEGKGRRGDEK